MKYLIILVLVLAVVWWWRRATPRPPGPPGAAAIPPQEMVRCPVCGTHLPRADALPGPDGRLYCCAEHRLRAEG